MRAYSPEMDDVRLLFDFGRSCAYRRAEEMFRERSQPDSTQFAST